MTVSKTQHIDASEPDDHGKYDYHYAYTTYVFAQDGIEYTARSYDDEPEKVAFVGKSVNAEAKVIIGDDLGLCGQVGKRRG